MRDVDGVRGYERSILFEPSGGHKTTGGTPVTNCVVEVLADDHAFVGFERVQGEKRPIFRSNGPALSLRFYFKPSRLKVDEETPIGVEVTLAPELSLSLIQQLRDRWPDFEHLIQQDLAEPPEE
jgi:hypothetical protein